MPRLPRITAADLLRALRRDGWEVVRQRGSHVHLQHPTKPGAVTLPWHASATVKPKTLLSVLEQAELTVDEFRGLL